jgi:CRP-like cAMP-binding protein
MDFRDTSTNSINTQDDDIVRTSVFYSRHRTGTHPRDTKASVSARAVQNGMAEPDNLILKSLGANTYALLEPFMKTVSVTKEQFLYQEDGRLDYLYFPLTAVVSEFKILEDGRMVEIAVTGREGAIGLSSMFSASHLAPNCTQVTQAGLAKRIDAVNFEKVLRSNPALRESLIGFVDPYIRQISQKAICNMYHSVKERLCTWLLMVQDRCGRTTLNLTHEQIARTLGVYRPSITCIAQELREKGLIDYSRGGISIVDRDKVEDAACTCYMELTSGAHSH